MPPRRRALTRDDIMEAIRGGHDVVTQRIEEAGKKTDHKIGDLAKTIEGLRKDITDLQIQDARHDERIKTAAASGGKAGAAAGAGGGGIVAIVFGLLAWIAERWGGSGN